MKFLAWIISAINIYFGIYNFLNAVGFLDSTKYSKASTIVFAILFLSMGAGGLYVSIVNNSHKLALLIGIGPWILSLAFLFFSMLTSDNK